MKEPTSKKPVSPQWALVRDAGVLQVKLLVDGLRDLILLPASLIAAVVSLVKSEDGQPGPQFYQLLQAGKDSETWINLFGALRNAPGEPARNGEFAGADIDELVDRVESFVLDEYRRGGVSAQAHDQLKKVLDRMQNRKPPNDAEPGQ